MTDAEAIRIAEEEIDRISYLLDCSPRIYDNPGMRKIYERKHEWLVQLLAIAKGAIEGYDPGWIPYTDPPKSDGRYEVAMKDGSLWHISVQRYCVNHQAWESGWKKQTGGVRFWRPLPASPKEIPK